MLCAIWYHLYNLNNVKNTHEKNLLLVTLRLVTFSNKSNTSPWVFFTFFKIVQNDIKSRKASHIQVSEAYLIC